MSCQFTGIIDSSLVYEEKVEILSRILPEYCSFDSSDVRAYAIGMYHVVRSMQFYDEDFPKLKCEAALIRPSIRIWHFPENYKIWQVRLLAVLSV